METNKPRIFISHAWEDKVLARRLEVKLINAGADVWVDHSGIRGGDNLPKRISDALEWCNTLLLIWSDPASKSTWVELEWTNAISLEKAIIPCLLDDTPVPAILTNKAYLNFRNVEQGIIQLLHALNRARQPVTETPTTPVEKVARVLHNQLSGFPFSAKSKPPQAIMQVQWIMPILAGIFLLSLLVILLFLLQGKPTIEKTPHQSDSLQTHFEEHPSKGSDSTKKLVASKSNLKIDTSKKKLNTEGTLTNQATSQQFGSEPSKHSVSDIDTATSLVRPTSNAKRNEDKTENTIPSEPDSIRNIIKSIFDEIQAERYGSMGSFYIRDENSRRVFLRFKQQVYKYSNKEVIDGLLAFFGDKDSITRWKAMRFLTYYKYSDSKQVRKFWNDESEWMERMIVLEALENLPQKEALDLIVDIARSDDNARIRSAAIGQINRYTNDQDRNRLIETFVEALSDDDHSVRLSALKQLRAEKAINEVSHLLPHLLLQKNDEDSYSRSMRFDAAEFFAEQGPIGSIQYIFSAYQKDCINEYALKRCFEDYQRRFGRDNLLREVEKIKDSNLKTKIKELI